MLKELLLAAGYEVEIARANLEPAQSRTLLLHMFNEQNEAREAVDYSQTDLNDLLAGLGVENTQAKIDEALLEANQVEAEARADAEGQTQLILNALAAAGVTLGDPDIEAKLIAEAQDYFWVRYRQAASDGWQDAHLFEVWSLEPLETFAEDLPNELKHRFKLEAFIEKRVGEKLEVEPIMPAWEQTAASLVGKPINFTTMHTNLQSEEDFQNLGEVLAGNGFFMPLLDGELAPNGQFFDLAGNVVPPAIAGDKIAELVQEGAGQLTGAADALGGLGQESPPESTVATELTAYWLTYTLINPNGESTVYKRSFFDRLGQVNRDTSNLELAPREAIFDSVIGSQTFMLNVGEYSTVYILNKSINATLKFLTLSAEVYEELGKGNVLSVNDISEKLAAIQPITHFQIFDMFKAVNTEGASFRAGASLLVLHEKLSAEETTNAHFFVDIVHNVKRNIQVDSGTLTTAADQAVSVGAWETRAEVLYVETRFGNAQNNPYTDRQNSFTPNVSVVSPTQAIQINQFPTDNKVKEFILNDLSNGYHVILDAEHPRVWWRVNGSTGETLGMGPDGYGETEQIVLVTTRTPYLLSAFGAGLCTGITGDIVCCLIATAGLFLVGSLFGFLFKAISGLKVLAFNPLSWGFITSGTGGAICAGM